MSHYKHRYIPFLNEITRKYYPEGTPPIEDAFQKTQLIFTNTVSKTGYARPNIPAVVESGGLHCRPAKPLPNDLEAFMESSGDYGVVYFSLGSTVKGESMPRDLQESILRVFGKLPQKILWKFEGEIENLPPNVRVLKWIPQQDVLGEKKNIIFKDNFYVIFFCVILFVIKNISNNLVL